MTPRRTSRTRRGARSLLNLRANLMASALASTLAFTPMATAQTSSAAMAESLFVEARDLMAADDFAAACPKLRQSQDLDPQLGTLLNLGKCYEQNGQTASAWATFTELSRLASRAGQQARADYAAERVQALAPALAYLTLRIAAPMPELTVRIDDEQLSTAVLGSALAVDPGTHQLSVRAPNHHPYRRSLVVTPGSRQDMVVPALQPIAVTRPAPAPQPPVTPRWVPLPPPPVIPRSHESGTSSWWPVAITGYAVAGAGLTVGGVTGILALDAGGSLNCSMGACPPSDADNLSRANTLANVSNVSFAVAGAGAILGIIATVVALDDDPSKLSLRRGMLRF